MTHVLINDDLEVANEVACNYLYTLVQDHLVVCKPQALRKFTPIRLSFQTKGSVLCPVSYALITPDFRRAIRGPGPHS